MKNICRVLYMDAALFLVAIKGKVISGMIVHAAELFALLV
jgi:hypothetical protein